MKHRSQPRSKMHSSHQAHLGLGYSGLLILQSCQGYSANASRLDGKCSAAAKTAQQRSGLPSQSEFGLSSNLDKVCRESGSDNGMLVRTERLELSHLSILEPKSSASTNSATSAVWVRRLEKPFGDAHYTSPPVFAKNRRRCLLAVFAAILLRFP